MKEFVPENVLPPTWGGTNTAATSTDGEQEEYSVIGMGGAVPLYYQTVNKPHEIPGTGGAEELFPSFNIL